MIGSLALALGLTAANHRPAQAQATTSPTRLAGPQGTAELRVLDWTLWNISKNYVEPDRIDPRGMTLAGVEALENSIAQVLVEPDESRSNVRVRVGTEERVFPLDDIEALWAVGPRVREVFHFVTENTHLDHEDQQDAEYEIVTGVLATLDPHTNLLRPSDFADMKTSTKGSFGGLGIEVGMRNGAITVLRVIDGNPAAKVDMKAGDRIVQIDAESTVTMNLNDAVNRLRGRAGTAVDVYVMREGLKHPQKLTITRATIKLDSVIAHILTDDTGHSERKVGLVQIPRNFAQRTGYELREKLDEFADADVDGVILDLRDNPGGLLTAAVEVADAFVSSGVIVSTVGVSSPEEVSRATEGDDFPDKPLVVLVDQGSASASEIVAGALRNLGRAVLIGRRTFGKGSVQVLQERKVDNEELALKLTIAQYLTPGNVSIQSVGVSPDLETIPVWIGKEHVAYYGRSRFDLLREESLASHLESSSAQSTQTAHGPLYFLQQGSLEHAPSSSTKRDTPDSAERLLEDPEIRIARDLVLWAPTSDRNTLLSQMDAFVDHQRTIEQQRIAASLKQRGIEWTSAPPAKSGAPQLKIAIDCDKPNNTIRGGDQGKVTVRVTNTGNAPAYQVRGITDSDYRYFDERELFFGRIDPGETKAYDIVLSVFEHELTRTDRIDVHVFEQHGAKPTQDSTTHIDIRAEGLERPQFAYAYQIVDDPKLAPPGTTIKGNGDGLLQVGERVQLRVDVTNQGPGTALDTWVTLRTLSGEALFLPSDSGRANLKQLKPKQERSAQLALEVRHMPESGVAKLQLVVADNKIAEVVSDEVTFPISTSTTPLASISRGYETTGPATLYASPLGEHAIATAPTGAKLKATGLLGQDWIRVDTGGGGLAFVRSDAVHELDRVPRQSTAVEHTFAVTPPKIVLNNTVTTTEDTSITIQGTAIDGEEVRDIYFVVNNPSRDLFGRGEKVFYQAARDPKTGKLEFNAEVPLTPGNNLIEIHARQNDNVTAVNRMWVLRTSGLAEARAKDADFQSDGKLSVDTFR